MKSKNCTTDSSNANCEQVSPTRDLEKVTPAQRVRQLSSEDLFDGDTEVEIAHHGAFYRLRKTSLGKLILTK